MLRRTGLLLAAVLLVLFVDRPSLCGDAGDGPCSHGTRETLTDNFYFSASSAQGAVGDIVAIDFSLTVDEWISARLFGFSCLCCYDGEKIELVGEPRYTEEYDRLAYITWAFPLGGDVGPTHPRGEKGFLLGPNVSPSVAEDLLRDGNRLPLMTLFFRLKGVPGETAQIRFCDGEFVHDNGSCEENKLDYGKTEEWEGPFSALSDRHQPGLIRILPGEATQTEIPDVPPAARVYPDEPTPETTDILYELSGSVARPGSTDVPLDLYITSSHEFTSYSVSVTFPAELAQITRVEEAIRPGAVAIDNENGSVGLLLQDSRRRVGREGERVHVATLYVDVSDEAQVEAIPFRFEQAGNYIEWIGIRHTGGLSDDVLPVVAKVTPIVTQPALLNLQLRGTSPGDVNLDYTRDISDAVAILEYLFLGAGDLVCPAAADVNADGRVNLSDPVGLLRQLFQGASGPEVRDVFCDEGR